MYYACECEICKTQNLMWAEEDPYLFLGETFSIECKICGSATRHHRVLTREERSTLNACLAERALQNQITKKCNEFGFTCKFEARSVVITTPLANWCFDYHHSQKTLYHQRIGKFRFLFPTAHCKFRNKRMTFIDVMDYIADHDKWKARLQKAVYRQSRLLRVAQ